MAKQATREAYGRTLEKLGAERDFFVLDADLSCSTNTKFFADKYPERFFNCGIAESNMISVAAGMAASGTPVFASSFAMFATGRAFEQVRNSVGYPHLNVKIAASHSGVTVGEDGATHQCCEDIALMRTVPGMTVLSPADSSQRDRVGGPGGAGYRRSRLYTSRKICLRAGFGYRFRQRGRQGQGVMRRQRYSDFCNGTSCTRGA